MQVNDRGLACNYTIHLLTQLLAMLPLSSPPLHTHFSPFPIVMSTPGYKYQQLSFPIHYHLNIYLNYAFLHLCIEAKLQAVVWQTCCGVTSHVMESPIKKRQGDLFVIVNNSGGNWGS